VINAHTDPPVVGGHSIETIRHRLAQVRIGEIVRPDCFRGALRLPFLALVRTLADQCLFLRINGHPWLAPLLESPYWRVHVCDRRVPVGVRAALAGLAVGVQALLQGVQQMRHGPGTDTMPLPLKCLGQLPCALARPAQRGHGVPTGRWLNQGLQSLDHGWIGLDDRWASASRHRH
jgi:hypothetical protein